jgi:hypothetical protein
MGALAPCPGGATGMPQQQAPMMNSQGVQPAVFRPTQTQVCFRSKLKFLTVVLSLVGWFSWPYH